MRTCEHPELSNNLLNKKSIQWTQKSNLSQQQQKNFLVKNDFGTTKSKKFSWKFFFLSEKNLKKIFGKHFLKKISQLQVTIPSAHPVQLQVVQCTASLCHNVVSHKKSKKTIKSQKRGLATNVQPESAFSRTCSFYEVFGINEASWGPHENCLDPKFHWNRYSHFWDMDKKISNTHQKWVFSPIYDPQRFFFWIFFSTLSNYT